MNPPPSDYEEQGEFELIEAIRKRIPRSPYVKLGIGDDAACMASGDPGQLVTTDMLLEGVHFLIPPATPRQVACKSVNVNLSDIAAMGGIPSALFVSICWPSHADVRFRNEFCQALEESCTRYGVCLAGGDTNSWNGPLVVSVTAVGRLEGSPWCRNGAKPGDWIFVTGEFGGSILGKHLDFVPRVLESQMLRRIVSPTSMIDVSDGLSADLFHLLDESQVGAVIQEASIPISSAAQSLCDDRSPLQHALGDGEDFELLFTVSPEEGAKLQEMKPFETTLTRIGTIQKDRSVILVRLDNKKEPLLRVGWVHSLS